METIVIVPTAAEAAFFTSNPLICGVGMAECAAFTARLIAEETAKCHSEGAVATRNLPLFILAGIAGAYLGGTAGPHGALEIGETVVVASETVADLSPARYRKTYTATLFPAGLKTVGSNTVSTAGTGSGENAEIENMEGAAFFAVCEKMGVPFVEIRTISNRVGEPISRENMELATKALAVAVEKLI